MNQQQQRNAGQTAKQSRKILKSALQKPSADQLRGLREAGIIDSQGQIVVRAKSKSSKSAKGTK
jgi:hypothetical protein